MLQAYEGRATFLRVGLLAGAALVLALLVNAVRPEGIAVVRPDALSPSLLAPQGVLGKKKPSPEEWADIRFGWGIAKTLGSLDIALYRDDWTVRGHKPSVGSTRIPFDVEGKALILVDDVLFTGRTIRAALEALVDFGRPSRIELLVLVDRGHRELPIHADYVGLCLETSPADRVDVLVSALDGEEGVRLVTPA